jgi:hypothetical protein
MQTVTLFEDVFGPPPDHRSALQFAAVEFAIEFAQISLGLSEQGFPGCGVLLGSLRATIPDQTISFLCLLGPIGGSPIGVDRVVSGSSLVFDPQEIAPSYKGALPELGAELLVFRPVSRQHRDELASILSDVLKVLFRTQLTVRHVYEILSAEDLTEEIYVPWVNGIVGSIAAVDVVSDGHSAVGSHIETEDQLLQIGAMILVVAVYDLWTFDRALVLAI